MTKTARLVYDTTECERCGGTGRYSYNSMHGSRCYGCNGSGTQLTRDGARAKAAITTLRKTDPRLIVAVEDLCPGDRILDGRTILTVVSVVLSETTCNGQRLYHITGTHYRGMYVHPGTTFSRTVGGDDCPRWAIVRDCARTLRGVTVVE